jgi:hypothetical protein
MKSDGIGKDLLVTFVIAVVLYVGFYSWDRHMRLRKGPWEVAFVSDGKGAPAIVINEPKLNISNVRIELMGEQISAVSSAVIFDEPSKRVPFGTLVFDDLMYQPGTVTLNLFGHEIELLPRTLIVNKKQIPWSSGTVIQLQPEQKLPPSPPRKKK